jgi:hypothetical protein
MIPLTTILSSNITKYVAVGALVATVWVHGYVQGLQHAVENAPVDMSARIIVQNKITEKVITKYIKQKEVKNKVNEEIKHEGQGFAIKYPDIGYANNEFVWLYNNSILSTISPLPEGELGDSSGVPYSEVLNTSIHNNIVGIDWKDRALACEQWTEEQEKANIK